MHRDQRIGELEFGSFAKDMGAKNTGKIRGQVRSGTMLVRKIGSSGEASMKKLALVFLVLQTAFVVAASDKAKDKPNPADFTITVHVVSSGTQTECVSGLCYVSQLLEAVVDGQPVEVQGGGIHDQPVGLLALGDYQARVSSNVRVPKNSSSWDVYRGYDLLMPDGTARTYTVTRLGAALSHP